jgi:hypothetical protein
MRTAHHGKYPSLGDNRVACCWSLKRHFGLKVCAVPVFMRLLGRTLWIIRSLKWQNSRDYMFLDSQDEVGALVGYLKMADSERFQATISDDLKC